MSSIKEQVCTNPSSFSLLRRYICWGYRNFKATEAWSFVCQLCSVVFPDSVLSGVPANWTICLSVWEKNTGYILRKSAFGTVHFELGSGSAAGLFAWRAPQMRMYVTGLHQMFREKQEEHTDQCDFGFYVSRLLYGGHAELNGSVKKQPRKQLHNFVNTKTDKRK